MKKIHYLKMHGAGNDFIMLDNRELKLDPSCFSALAARLCSRRLSVGADGLMVADLPQRGGDVKMYFFNSDGSAAEMCGNGARCIGRYGYENFAQKDTVVIETTAGDVPAHRVSERIYQVQLNIPEILQSVVCDVDGDAHKGWYVELGNPGSPHGVFLTEGLAEMDYEKVLADLGSKLRWHSTFPKGANINFCQILAPDHVLIRTFERGVEGFTMACGTGSGSTISALQFAGMVQRGPVTISNPGGELIVEPIWEADKIVKLLLTGPTNIVADGYITDEDFEL